MIYCTRNYSSIFDELFSDLFGPVCSVPAHTTNVKRYVPTMKIVTDDVEDKDTIEVLINTDMDKETCDFKVNKTGKMAYAVISGDEYENEYVETLPCKVEQDGIRKFYNPKRKQIKYVLKKVKEEVLKDEFIEILPETEKKKPKQIEVK